MWNFAKIYLVGSGSTRVWRVRQVCGAADFGPKGVYRAAARCESGDIPAGIVNPRQPLMAARISKGAAASIEQALGCHRPFRPHIEIEDDVGMDGFAALLPCGFAVRILPRHPSLKDELVT
ncbi:hypothetical protein EFD56_06030 [Rhizobium phaseoli]|nr:hypothetical protein EFD56_06030 [Rhizobium phaseoli]